MKKIWVLVAAFGMLAAACGGTSTITVDDQTASSTGGDDDAGEPASGDDGEPADGESDDSSGADDGDANQSSGNSSASNDFCALAAEREAQESSFDDINIFDPEEVRAAFDANLSLLAEAVQAAPEEIRDDLVTVGADLDRIYEVLDSIDFDFSQMTGDLDAELEEMPESEAAGERIDAYVENVCGIDPDANEDGGPTDEEIREQAREAGAEEDLIKSALEEVGLTGDQATCLSQKLDFDDLAAFGSDDPPLELLDVFTECGVSIQELAALGGSGIDDGDIPDLPDDIPPAALAVFVDELVNGGFEQAEAECLAGAMFGDSETQGDMVGALEACEIPLSRLAELGQAADG